jgi:hypothetical protein
MTELTKQIKDSNRELFERLHDPKEVCRQINTKFYYIKGLLDDKVIHKASNITQNLTFEQLADNQETYKFYESAKEELNKVMTVLFDMQAFINAQLASIKTEDYLN